jgi:hypothetical protein
MLMLGESFWSDLDKGIVFWLVGGTVAVVWIVATAIHHVLVAQSQEKTKREIAAYVAEGSIDKDTAIAMLKANVDADDESKEA